VLAFVCLSAIACVVFRVRCCTGFTSRLYPAPAAGQPGGGGRRTTACSCPTTSGSGPRLRSEV